MNEWSHHFTVAVTIDEGGAVTWTESCGGFLFMANASATFRGVASDIGGGRLAFRLGGRWSCSGAGGDCSEDREFSFTGTASGAGLHVERAPLAPPSQACAISRPRLLPASPGGDGS